MGAAAGVVPASGRSVRMGAPKGLLLLEGRTFLSRVLETLREGGCAPLVCVVRGTDDADALSDEALAAGAAVLENPDPDPGPISSLRRALEHLDPSIAHVVWLPLDHPRVRADTVATLIAEARTSGAPVTLPLHQGTRGHPAVFARAVFPELTDPALTGGARTVVHRYLDRARLVDTDDPGVLVDVDTPEDYRALLSETGLPDPPPIP